MADESKLKALSIQKEYDEQIDQLSYSETTDQSQISLLDEHDGEDWVQKKSFPTRKDSSELCYEVPNLLRSMEQELLKSSKSWPEGVEENKQRWLMTSAQMNLVSRKRSTHGQPGSQLPQSIDLYAVLQDPRFRIIRVIQAPISFSALKTISWVSSLELGTETHIIPSKWLHENGSYDFLIKWPSTVQGVLNGQQVFSLEPLPRDMSQKHRKDSKYIFKPELGKKYTFEMLCKAPFQDSFFFTVLEVLKEHSFDMMIEKAYRMSPTQVENMHKQYFSRESNLRVNRLKIRNICPLSLAGLKIPVRGIKCTHFSCFCLVSFLKMLNSSNAIPWQCPICRKSCHEFVVDSLIELVLRLPDLPIDQEIKYISLDRTGKIALDLRARTLQTPEEDHETLEKEPGTELPGEKSREYRLNWRSEEATEEVEDCRSEWAPRVKFEADEHLGKRGLPNSSLSSDEFEAASEELTEIEKMIIAQFGCLENYLEAQSRIQLSCDKSENIKRRMQKTNKYPKSLSFKDDRLFLACLESIIKVRIKKEGDSLAKRLAGLNRGEIEEMEHLYAECCSSLKGSEEERRIRLLSLLDRKEKAILRKLSF